jgi:hypothetical protein|tara:strand:- start:280 stop:456 length:177 start_codon:yes stop_codon:yes gene_type:complete
MIKKLLELVKYKTKYIIPKDEYNSLETRIGGIISDSEELNNIKFHNMEFPPIKNHEKQ